MSLTAQPESFTAAKPELEQLFPLHWDELALDKDKVPLSPRWEQYETLEKAGVMLFVTLRNGQRLVGYYVGFIMPHLHYSTCVTLTNDIFWTHPSVRGGTAGRRLFRAVEDEARKRGVMRTGCETKRHFDAGRMLIALGYRPTGTVYTKWIGA